VNFFLHEKRTGWVVSHVESGYCVWSIPADTKQIAVDRAEELLKKFTREVILRVIENAPKLEDAKKRATPLE
jgi:hypothetical protein